MKHQLSFLAVRVKIVRFFSLFFLSLVLLIAKIFVDKHCFCYFNVENVKQKNSLFYKPIVIWLAY